MAVRNESVRLSLEDAGFSTGMAKAAAATAVLDQHLDALDNHGTTASRRFTSMTSRADKFSTSLGSMNAQLGATNQGLASFGGNDGGMGRFTRAASAGDHSINQLTGRLRLFADLAATVGPGLIPIAAVGVPAVTGLATALAAAGTAGAGALVAFQGVGDAITAVEKARLEPTVANLEAAQQAMAQIGPDARNFVEAFQELRPVLGDIRDSAAAGLFPGLTEAMGSFEELAPRVSRILEEVNRASGEAIAGGMESLTTERWTPFFDFIAREMPSAVADLSRTLGDLAHGASEMWMAFDPGNDAFLDWVEGIADGFDDWASSAAGREDLTEFLAYVRETGPQVADFFGSMVDLVTQVAQAAAPLGGPVLDGLTAIADVMATIADSDIGTPILAGVAAIALYNRSLQATEGLLKRAGLTGAASAVSSGGLLGGLGTGASAARTGIQGLSGDLRSMRQEYGKLGPVSAIVTSGLSNTTGAAQRTREALKGVAKGGAAMAGIGLLATGIADDMGVTSTATLALTGAMIGGVPGAIAGGLVGAVVDVANAGAEADRIISDLEATFASSSATITDWHTQMQAAATAAEAEFADMDSTTGPVDLISDIGPALQGLFGDSPGTRLADAVKSANVDLVDMNAILSDVNNQLGGTAFGIGEIVDENGNVKNVNYSLQDMERVATSLQPAMSALGYGLHDLFDEDRRQEVVDYMQTYDTAPARLGRLSDAFAGLRSEMLTDAQVASNLQIALEGLTTGLTASAAVDAFRASLLGMKDALANFDVGKIDLLHGMNEGALVARNEVRGQFEALNAELVAMAADGAGPKAIARALREGAESIVEFGKKAGLGEKELRAFLKQIGLTPAMVKTVFEAAGIDANIVKARRARDAFNSLPKDVRTDIKANGIPQTIGAVDKLVAKYKLTEEERKALISLMDHASPTIRGILALLRDADGFHAESTITTVHRNIYRNESGQVTSGNGTVLRDAMGGMHYNGVRTFALGGMDRPNSHIPEFAGPGPTRMWREPETKGESYIPWANDHRRPRAKSVLEQTAELFGGQVQWFARGGMSDWRDYYTPMGQTHASTGNGAFDGILASLNALLAGVHDLSEKELKIRLRDLDLTEKQLDKILDKREERAKKEADADKARLDAMVEAQRSFEEQVAGLFKSDLFGKGESTTIARFPDGSFIDLGKDINELTPEDYLEHQQRGATFESSSGVGGAADILGGDIQNLEESIRLIQILRKKGFSGPAFQELVGQAANDPESLSAYASMSRGELDNLEKLYGQRDRLMGTVGNVAGKDMNADIRGLRKDYRESVTELRETKQEIRGLRREVAELKEIERKAPRETGEAVGAAVGGVLAGVASDAGRGR